MAKDFTKENIQKAISTLRYLLKRNENLNSCGASASGHPAYANHPWFPLSQPHLEVAAQGHNVDNKAVLWVTATSTPSVCSAWEASKAPLILVVASV